MSWSSKLPLIFLKWLILACSINPLNKIGSKFEEGGEIITTSLSEPVSLTFGLKYSFSNF